MAPHSGVCSLCSTNVLLNNNCKRKILLRCPFPRRVFPPGALAGLGLVGAMGSDTEGLCQDTDPSPTGPGRAAAAGRDGGVQGERQGMRKNQPGAEH